MTCEGVITLNGNGRAYLSVRRVAMSTSSDARRHELFVKEMQERFEKKLRENERMVLEYWKAQLDKVIAMKPEGIASLQLQIKKISEMMGNRIKILKKE